MTSLAQALDQLIGVLIPIFVAMDPVGTIPLIVAWTSNLPPPVRRRQLDEALATALSLGIIFLIGGKWLLSILEVDVNDFLIAGGLILLVLAVSDLVVGGGHEARGSLTSPDFGVVPIGTPLLAGPATLTTVIVLGDRYGVPLTAVGLLINLLIAWRLFLAADRMTGLFGRNGLRAASKVVSLLLAAIAVKYIREGLLAIIHAAAG